MHGQQNIKKNVMHAHIPKATNTHTKYNFPTVTMVARTLLNVTLYVTCLSENVFTFEVIIFAPALSRMKTVKLERLSRERQLRGSPLCVRQTLLGHCYLTARTSHFPSACLPRKTRRAMNNPFLEATYVCGMEEILSSLLFKNDEWEP